MTTEKSVSADNSGNNPATPEEEKIAQQVVSAAVDEQKVTPETNGSRAITLEDLERVTRDIENKVQGRTANWNSASFNRQFEDLKNSLRQDFRSEINNAVTAQANAQAEMVRIDSLDPEEQVEYWRGKALNPEQSPEAAEPQQSGGLTEDEQKSLAAYAVGVLKAGGLDTKLYSDPSYWAGASADMSVDQMAEVFYTNVQKQKAPATPAASLTQATPPPPPPPSTQDAPASPSATYDSKTEVAAAFGRGEMNIDQYRAELGNLQQRR